MRATLCIDEAVGETRRALLDPFGKPFRLEIERWSERGRRAKLDEVWWGRATGRMPGGPGWFVDIGLADEGVIETTRATLTEGGWIPVRVKTEAWADKGAVLSLADMKADAVRPAKAGRHAAPADDPFLRGVEVIATIREKPAREQVDAAIEEALARTLILPNGGDLSIERTRALTAIDVDAADRKAAGERETFALNLNLEAAGEAARQVGLRGIGGLLAVDFVGMEQKKSRKAVADAFREALQLWLGRASEVLELSQFGVCEAAVARRLRPAADAIRCEPAEREGLDALRLVESEGWANAGAKVRARVSADAAAWLERDAIGWKAMLAERIGQRWSIDASQKRPGPPEVWSEK